MKTCTMKIECETAAEYEDIEDSAGALDPEKYEVAKDAGAKTITVAWSQEA